MTLKTLPGLSLVGFMDKQDALEYLRTQCIFDDTNDDVLEQYWDNARMALGNATPKAGSPGIADIPLQHKGYLDGVHKNPRYMGTVAELNRAAFRLVEIAPLLAFQFHVHTERTRSKTAAIDGNAPMKKLLDLCLPRYNPPLPASVLKPTIADNALIFECDDINFQPLPNLLGGENKPDESVSVTVQMARSSPFVQVAHFRGRYYLKNGYHRAYQLGKMGFTHIPCIVGEAATWEQVVGKGSVAFSQDLLTSNNPPTVGHFV